MRTDTLKFETRTPYLCSCARVCSCKRWFSGACFDVELCPVSARDESSDLDAKRRCAHECLQRIRGRTRTTLLMVAFLFSASEGFFFRMGLCCALGWVTLSHTHVFGLDLVRTFSSRALRRRCAVTTHAVLWHRPSTPLVSGTLTMSRLVLRVLSSQSRGVVAPSPHVSLHLPSSSPRHHPPTPAAAPTPTALCSNNTCNTTTPAAPTFVGAMAPSPAAIGVTENGRSTRVT